MRSGSTTAARRTRGPHKGILSIALAALLAASGLAPWHAAAADGSDCGQQAGPNRTVVRITDGETIVLDDGAAVRLVGALSPRASDAAAEPASWPLEERAKQELEQLLLGKSVALAFAGRRSDRYGHLLAHVFVLGGPDPVWVQGHMLKQGLARAYGIPESTACMDQLLSHERLAREAGAGIWSEAAYQIRSADHIAELLRVRSTFQIVEGRVLNVSDRRGRVFINFGQDWRQDFTASLQPSAAKLAAGSGLNAQSLVGRWVRVRGWIDRRGGPYIEIDHPHQIEMVPAGAETAHESTAPRSRAQTISAATASTRK
jgi:endonuclease YncB( thermonuclease family)